MSEYLVLFFGNERDIGRKSGEVLPSGRRVIQLIGRVGPQGMLGIGMLPVVDKRQSRRAVNAVLQPSGAVFLGQLLGNLKGLQRQIDAPVISVQKDFAIAEPPCAERFVRRRQLIPDFPAQLLAHQPLIVKQRQQHDGVQLAEPGDILNDLLLSVGLAGKLYAVSMLRPAAGHRGSTPAVNARVAREASRRRGPHRFRRHVFAADLLLSRGEAQDGHPGEDNLLIAVLFLRPGQKIVCRAFRHRRPAGVPCIIVRETGVRSRISGDVKLQLRPFFPIAEAYRAVEDACALLLHQRHAVPFQRGEQRFL